jgi:SAM-dependent methyltransferase
MNVFDQMGIYWTEMADRNQTEEQICFIKDHFKASGYFLDLACGSGRHSIALNTDGYCMVGLDISRKLLRIAKERSNELLVVLGDMRFLPFRDGIFEVVVSLDNSFGYLSSDAEDIVSLIEVRRVLLLRGKIAIDVFNRLELTQKYQRKSVSSKPKDYPSFKLEQKRTVRGSWLYDIWIVSDKSNNQTELFEHKVHLYFQSQLESMLIKAGFKIKMVFGDYNGINFSDESPRLIFIAEAK